MNEKHWKQIHADASCEALDHQLVKNVIDELMWNLSACYSVNQNDSFVLYGCRKVAMYAAQVARAQAQGFDPNLLKLTEDEGNKELMLMAEALVRAGKPVTLLIPPPRVPA